MEYRIKLICYSIYIWLMRKVIWAHDVIFTFIDNQQLKVWVKLRGYELELSNDRIRHERDHLQNKGLDSWDEEIK